MGAVFVAIVTAVIVSDTVKYYDHFGVSDRKMAIGLGIGTIAATYISLMISDLADNSAHFAITIAQVSLPLHGEDIADLRHSSWPNMLILITLQSPYLTCMLIPPRILLGGSLPHSRQSTILFRYSRSVMTARCLNETDKQLSRRNYWVMVPIVALNLGNIHHDPRVCCPYCNLANRQGRWYRLQLP